jgi:hypothetical protein
MSERLGKFADGIYSLYAHPAPAQKPLSHDQVSQMVQWAGYDAASPQERADFINGIRHREAKHGIKEKP